MPESPKINNFAFKCTTRLINSTEVLFADLTRWSNYDIEERARNGETF